MKKTLLVISFLVVGMTAFAEERITLNENDSTITYKKCEKISLYLAEVSVYLAEDLYAIGRSTTGTFISPLRYFKNFSASAPSAPYSIFEKASASFKKRQSRKSKTISHFSHSFLVVLREIAKTSDFLQKKPSHTIDKT